MEESDETDVIVATGEDVEKFDHDTYRAFTIAAKLKDIKLLSASYLIKPDVFEAVDDLDNMAFSGECSGFHFDGEFGSLAGQYSWVAEIKYGRKKVLKNACDYLIVYGGVAGFEELYARYYFEKVARFATYPYFRACFSQNAAASGIMLPPLPALNERVD